MASKTTTTTTASSSNNVTSDDTEKSTGDNNNNNNSEEVSPEEKKKIHERFMSYVPAIIRPYVHHYYEDFYVSLSFDPSLASILMYHGFLPIATKQDQTTYLLPKLHEKRCICRINQPNVVHVSKGYKRKSKKYFLQVNTDFDAVVAGCHSQHGIPWLYPPMVEMLRAMWKKTKHGTTVYSIELYREENNVSSSSMSVDKPPPASKKQRTTHKVLVAGELGYTVGAVYTSLTGFSRESGAGTVQLLALAGLLKANKFSLWDLGMEMDYKSQCLGAINIPREEFLKDLHSFRDTSASLCTTSDNDSSNARSLINNL